MNEENIVALLADLFGASLETTTTIMTLAIYCLACHPDIQDCLYKQLSDVVAVNSITVRGFKHAFKRLQLFSCCIELSKQVVVLIYIVQLRVVSALHVNSAGSSEAGLPDVYFVAYCYLTVQSNI